MLCRVKRLRSTPAPVATDWRRAAVRVQYGSVRRQSEISVHDRLQPAFSQQLESAVGDFIVHRADGLFSYQIAVVVDDAEQRISHIVRGADLLDSTPRQIYLQQLLGLPVPDYLHLPVAVNTEAHKLSKQSHARPVDSGNGTEAVIDVLRFLHQPLPESPRDASLDELWQWAIEHWDETALPAQHSLAAPAPTLPQSGNAELSAWHSRLHDYNQEHSTRTRTNQQGKLPMSDIRIYDVPQAFASRALLDAAAVRVDVPAVGQRPGRLLGRTGGEIPGLGTSPGTACSTGITAGGTSAGSRAAS